MRFSMNKWRSTYDEVQYLGKMLRDSRPTVDPDTKDEVPAVAALSKETQEDLELSIKSLLINSNTYLDHCGMKAANPKWIYNPKDARTWPSDVRFIYKNLL